MVTAAASPGRNARIVTSTHSRLVSAAMRRPSFPENFCVRPPHVICIQGQCFRETTHCQFRESNAPNHRCSRARNALYFLLPPLSRFPRLFGNNALRIRRNPPNVSLISKFCRSFNKFSLCNHHLDTQPLYAPPLPLI